MQNRKRSNEAHLGRFARSLRIMRNGRDIAAIVRTDTREHEREKTAQGNWRGELLRARSQGLLEDLS